MFKVLPTCRMIEIFLAYNTVRGFYCYKEETSVLPKPASGILSEMWVQGQGSNGTKVLTPSSSLLVSLGFRLLC
jgi:hypothetical protein